MGYHPFYCGRHCVIERLRIKRTVALDEALSDYGEASSLAAYNERAQEVYLSVMSLEEKYAIPVYLYYYEGYTTGEIATMLDTKPSTIQTRLAKARELLKMELE